MKWYVATREQLESYLPEKTRDIKDAFRDELHKKCLNVGYHGYEVGSYFIEELASNTDKKRSYTKTIHYFVRFEGEKDWHYNYTRVETHSEHKFLCLGGPLDGEYETQSEVRKHDYYGFNNAGTSGHTKIWIHNDLIHEN
jgi:hypothetical protein